MESDSYDDIFAALRHRTNVDFPQPEGPMMAVTALASMERFTFFKACLVANQAFRLMVCIFMPVGTEFCIAEVFRWSVLSFISLFSLSKPASAGQSNANVKS